MPMRIDLGLNSRAAEGNGTALNVDVSSSALKIQQPLLSIEDGTYQKVGLSAALRSSGATAAGVGVTYYGS